MSHPIEDYLAKIPESERPAALADLQERMRALPPKPELDPYEQYAAEHGPMVTLKAEHAHLPELRIRLRALATRRGVPFVVEPANSPAHEHMLDRARAKGLIPGGEATPRIGNDGTISKTDTRAFLANLSAIASGKVKVVA